VAFSITGLLAWLGREKDCDEAIERILQTIPANQRDDLKSKISLSMAMYLEEEKNEFSRELAPENVPEWLFEEHTKALVPSWMVDVLCNGEILLQSQVEDVRSLSSHLKASAALRRTVALLLTTTEQGLPGKIKVQVRNGRTIRPVYLELTSADAAELTLEEVRKTSQDEKETSVLGAAQLSEKETVLVKAAPSPLKLFLAALSWWVKQEPVSFKDLNAFVAVLTLKQALGQLSFPVNHHDDLDIESAAQKLKRLRARWPEGLRQQFKKRYQQDGDALNFIRKLVSPFQARLYHLSQLAKVVDAFYLVPDVPTLIDGTALYNARMDFEDKVSVADVVGENLAALSDAVSNYLEQFVDLSLLEQRATKSLSTKQTKAKKKGDQVILNDLGNRFELLTVE